MLGIILAMNLKNLADGTPVTFIPRASSRFVRHGFDQAESMLQTFVRLVPHAEFISCSDGAHLQSRKSGYPKTVG